MEEFTTKFVDDRVSALEEAVGGMFTLGITNVVEQNLKYKCEIIENATGLIGKAQEWMPDKNEAYAAAFQDLVKQKRILKDQSKLQFEKEYSPKSKTENDDSSSNDWFVKLIFYGALIIGAIWLAFAVALPLVIINIATIALIAGFAYKNNKQYLFILSLLGTIFIVADYNKGWLTKTLVNNVNFFTSWIPFFLYLNIVAGLIASYFLIRDFVNERKPPLNTGSEFSKRNLIIMASLLVVGGAIIGLQKYFDSKVNYAAINNINSYNQSYTPAAQAVVSTTTSAGNNNNYNNGHFKGAWFEIIVPPDFTVRPSMKSSSANGYESAFFDSPDGDVSFYIFSPQWGGEPNDIDIDQNIEKTSSTFTQKSKNNIITWREIKAIDGSYFRAYQDTKSGNGNIHWIVGLKYKSKAAYEKYKRAYLSFKKSLKQFAD